MLERGRHLRSLIDPEALLLVSLLLMRDERRLADLLHDWTVRNSDLLSVQRLKNLEAGYPKPVQDTLTQRLAWFATLARDEGKDLRWRSVAKLWQDRSHAADAHADDASAAPHEPRARLEAKARATRARLTTDASLLLRLRLGIGVGVRADMLAFLLARADGWATVREITEATAYTPTAVRRAADDLAAARLIQARKLQPASYLAAYSAWAPVLDLKDRPPAWASWHERFVFVTAFLDWAEAAPAHPLSRYAFGAHGRNLLERYRPAFDRDLVAVWSAHSPIQDWAAFLNRAVQSLIAWMEKMG